MQSSSASDTLLDERDQLRMQNGPSSQPSARELAALVLASAVIFLGTCSLLHGWRSLSSSYGDNPAYAGVAFAIARWDFRGLGIQHFMGYPYALALLSTLFRISPWSGLWLVSWMCSAFSVALTARLLGTRVAAYFALTSMVWIQTSFLGGAEPLAVALGLGAFWLFRRQQWFLSSVLASLSVTVRPLMICVLIGMGLTLLCRKQYRQFLLVFATGVVVGFLYALPLALYFGDPLLTVHSYTTRDYGAATLKGPHGHLFGWPFHGIIVGTVLYPGPWTNLALSYFWILLVLVGVGMMFSSRFREYASDHPAEAVFCASYLYLVFSYDYLVWARSAFMRFAIPALPFVFFALLRYLPKNRYVLWLLALVSPILAAVSAVGLRKVLKL